MTPLIWAAIHGHVEVVKLLIESGADVNRTSKVCHHNLNYIASTTVVFSFVEAACSIIACFQLRSGL
jgi:ankyrin repeat protein